MSDTGPFLRTTRDADLQSGTVAGQAIHRLHGQLQMELREISQAAAQLFAEPSADPVLSEIEWFSQVSGTGRQLVALDPAVQETVKAHLRQVMADIQTRAEMLQASEHRDSQVMGEALIQALDIPDSSYVYEVGGRPVIVGWGHREKGPAAPRHVLRTLAAPTASAGASGAEALAGGVSGQPGATAVGEASSVSHGLPEHVTPAQTGTSHTNTSHTAYRQPGQQGFAIASGLETNGLAVGPGTVSGVMSGAGMLHQQVLTTGAVVEDDRRGWIGWLLFAATVLLVLLAVWLALRHCALGWPGSTGLQGLLSNYCPAPAISATQRDDGGLAAERDALENRAHQLELEIAERRGQCRLADAEPLEDEPELPVVTVPQDPVEPPQPDPVGEVQDQGGRIDDINIILDWQGIDDLDLSVSCPGGDRIFFSRKQACGGELDVDMNAGRRSDDPVENIVWSADSIPPGTYSVRVTYYSDRPPETPVAPFRVILRIGGEIVEDFSGELTLGQSMQVFTFTWPQGG